MRDGNLQSTELAAAVKPITIRYFRVNNNLLINGVNKLARLVPSNKVSNLIPDHPELNVSGLIELALWHVYDVAERTQSDDNAVKKEIKGWKFLEILKVSEREEFNKAAAILIGLAGGAGGLATTIVELPVTIGLIFREIQLISKEYRNNPASDETKQKCLSVFLTGTPSESDNTVEIEFISARLALQGGSITFLIEMIAPQLLRILGPKLVSPPVIGAVAGAVVNYVYINYYRELAHVNFQLDELERTHDAKSVAEEFKRQVEARRIGRR